MAIHVNLLYVVIVELLLSASLLITFRVKKNKARLRIMPNVGDLPNTYMVGIEDDPNDSIIGVRKIAVTSSTSKATVPKATVSEEAYNNGLIVAYIRPKVKQTFSGTLLLQHILNLGFRYGEMNIFHKHEQNNGQGKKIFSLALLQRSQALSI